MDRRDFLKVLGVVSVAPVVLAKAFEPDVRRYKKLAPNLTPLSEGEVPKFSELRNGSGLFDPDRTYGDFITVSDYIDPSDPSDPVLQTAVRFLEEDAHCFVPQEYRWRIRYEVNWPGQNTDPLNQLATVTWKYVPATATATMVREQERLFFGSCRSGKTDSVAAEMGRNMAESIDRHCWDV
jgi:hypothetical protein